MNKNIAGVSVPQDLIDAMASAPKEQAIAKGIEIAGRMIKRIHDEQNVPRGSHHGHRKGRTGNRYHGGRGPGLMLTAI